MQKQSMQRPERLPDGHIGMFQVLVGFGMGLLGLGPGPVVLLMKLHGVVFHAREAAHGLENAVWPCIATLAFHEAGTEAHGPSTATMAMVVANLWLGAAGSRVGGLVSRVYIGFRASFMFSLIIE